jgi:hypothetical protein
MTILWIALAAIILFGVPALLVTSACIQSSRTTQRIEDLTNEYNHRCSEA